jgi:hypothetical protein
LFAGGGRNAVEVIRGVAVDGVGGSFDSHGVYRVVGHSGCARTFVRE